MRNGLLSKHIDGMKKYFSFKTLILNVIINFNLPIL